MKTLQKIEDLTLALLEEVAEVKQSQIKAAISSKKIKKNAHQYASAKLCELRNERGLTQMDLGRIMGRSHTQIQHWEYCRNRMNVENIAELSAIFNVNPAVFFEDHGNE